MPRWQRQASDRGIEKTQKTRQPGSVNQGPAALLEEPDLLTLQRAVAHPELARAGDIRALQRRYGNQAVQRSVVQHQTPEEEEELQLKTVQRQPSEEEEALAMKPLQRVGPEGGPVPRDVESAINRARGSGQPLESGLQAQMGETMGHDFSEVRVHTGPESDELNHRLSARAFAIGSDIFFRRGEYIPGSSGGQELIAHELSHVVQQGTGIVSGSGIGLTASPAGAPAEQAADDLARRVSLPTRSGKRATWVGIGHELGVRDGVEDAHSPRAAPSCRPPLSRKTETVDREEVGGSGGVKTSRRLPPIHQAVSRVKGAGRAVVIQRQLVYNDQPGNVEVPVGSLLFGQAGLPKSVVKLGKEGHLPVGAEVVNRQFTHAAIYKGNGLIWEFWGIPGEIKERPAREVELVNYVAMSPPNGLEISRLLKAMDLIRAASDKGNIKYVKAEAKGEWQPFYNELVLLPQTSYCVDIVARAYQFTLRIMPVAGSGPERKSRVPQELGRHMSVQELYEWAAGAGFKRPRTVALWKPEPVTPAGAEPMPRERSEAEKAVVW